MSSKTISSFSLDRALQREEKIARAIALAESHHTDIKQLTELIALLKDEITGLHEKNQSLTEQIALISEALPIDKAFEILSGGEACNSQ